ncbi:MAG: hypothetical protein QM526_00815 [Alphaproteobacteria bacterium]|nr:hypothetical protein [Alphaproteobacteria bacterium]
MSNFISSIFICIIIAGGYYFLSGPVVVIAKEYHAQYASVQKILANLDAVVKKRDELKTKLSTFNPEDLEQARQSVPVYTPQTEAQLYIQIKELAQDIGFNKQAVITYGDAFDTEDGYIARKVTIKTPVTYDQLNTFFDVMASWNRAIFNESVKITSSTSANNAIPLQMEYVFRIIFVKPTV